MYCKKCGMEVEDNTKICPTCGYDFTKEEKYEDPFSEYEKVEEVKETEVKTIKPDVAKYKVFAIIGYVLGIVSIALCWIPFMFYTSIPGIIFSKLGVKSTTKNREAKTGFTLSVVSTVINVIVTIGFFALIGYISAEYIDEAIEMVIL